MTIHDEHPFLGPDRDEVRRLRARVGATVSLWTSGSLAAGTAAGLPVSSWLVVAGDTGRLLGALDPDADLAARLADTGRAVVQLLHWPDRDLAEQFAGTMPAPGGPFRGGGFVDTPAGPRLERATTWADVRLESATPVGWSLLVTTVVEQLVVGGSADQPWLVHRGGRFQRPAEGAH
jgi:flavin reductase (DIM6/NTAB) family NADH-FMN oxidoreductase RutF